MNKLQEGVNDLATAFPKLLSEWCYDKNTIDPKKIYYGSVKTAWWKCPRCNNIYDTAIRNRTVGSNCPFCSGRRVLCGFNDLETWCKNNNINIILDEWDYEKNDIKPTEVTHSTQKKVWWICKKCGNNWEASIANRIKGKGCPECGKKKIWEVRRPKLLYKKGSFSETNPELLKEWNYKKNQLDPNEITYGCRKKVWWICKKCGNNWEASIVSRVHGYGCPLCGIKKSLKSKKINIVKNRGSLQDSNAFILKEWDYEKNITITPDSITTGSSEKIWWICSQCGNSYQSRLDHRMNGVGCPKCAKEMQSSFPEQAVYYYVKKIFPDAINGDRIQIAPLELDIYIPSIKTAIEYDGQAFHKKDRDIKKNRLCEEKGIFLYRIRENKCEIIPESKLIKCLYVKAGDFSDLGKAISEILNVLSKKNPHINIESDQNEILNLYIKRKKENCLAVLYPELSSQWDYDNNKNLKPDMFLPQSNTKVWWICNNNHSYSSTIINRVNGQGCPYCSKRKLLVGFNDFATCYPEIAKEWDYEKNDIKPTDVIGGAKRVWWICPKGHSYRATLNSRSSQDTGCPICTNKRVLSGINDLKTVEPKIALEWDYEKNGEIRPEYVNPGSDKKAWWICPKGHSYEASIRNRRTSGCPYCSGKKVLKGFNDLYTMCPGICKEWDYEKNEVTPFEVTAGSSKKMWWICSNKHSYQAAVSEKTGKHRTGCPYCSNYKVLAGFNDLATKNPELLEEWDYENNEFLPNEIVYSTAKKAWWICKKCGYRWYAQIDTRSRIKNKHGCPKCGKVQRAITIRKNKELKNLLNGKNEG